MPKPLAGYRHQRRVLALLPALGVTQDSFAAHLSDAWGRPVDPSLVSKWLAGERSMPVDAAVELALHADTQASILDAHAGERVLGPLARPLGCIVVRQDTAAGATTSGMRDRLLALGAGVGNLQASFLIASEDDHVDDAECAALDEAAQAIERQVAAFRSDVRRRRGTPQGVQGGAR